MQEAGTSKRLSGKSRALFTLLTIAFGAFVGAILPLLFGSSLGPEAGITGVIAGLCTWVGDRLRFVGKEMRELATAGTAAVLSAIFAAPLFGLFAPLAGYVDESNGATEAFDPKKVEIPRAKKVAVYLLAIAGALGAMAGLGAQFGGGMTLPRFSDIVLLLLLCFPLRGAFVMLAAALGSIVPVPFLRKDAAGA